MFVCLCLCVCVSVWVLCVVCWVVCVGWCVCVCWLCECSVCLSVCRSVCLSVCLSVSQSVSQSVPVPESVCVVVFLHVIDCFCMYVAGKLLKRVLCIRHSVLCFCCHCCSLRLSLSLSLSLVLSLFVSPPPSGSCFARSLITRLSCWYIMCVCMYVCTCIIYI